MADGSRGPGVAPTLPPTHIGHHGEVDDKAESTAKGHGDLPLETEVVGGREEVQQACDEAFHTYKLWLGTQAVPLAYPPALTPRPQPPVSCVPCKPGCRGPAAAA